MVASVTDYLIELLKGKTYLISPKNEQRVERKRNTSFTFCTVAFSSEFASVALTQNFRN